METVTTPQNLIRDLEPKNNQNTLPLSRFFLILIFVLTAGIITGFLISLSKKTLGKNGEVTKKTDIKQTAGIADKKTFKDKAEGILKEGGIDGEGNFHLERPGGESQNVYLTSTTVDLSLYTRKKIRVWGETFTAEKAGWLMDVGLVELLQ